MARQAKGAVTPAACCDAFGAWWRLALMFQVAQPSRFRRCICGSHLCPKQACTRSQGGAQCSLVVGRPVVRDARQRQQEGAVQRPRQALRCRRAGQLAQAEQQRPAVLRCNGCFDGGGLGRLCGSGCRGGCRSGAPMRGRSACGHAVVGNARSKQRGASDGSQAHMTGIRSAKGLASGVSAALTASREAQRHGACACVRARASASEWMQSVAACAAPSMMRAPPWRPSPSDAMWHHAPWCA